MVRPGQLPANRGLGENPGKLTGEVGEDSLSDLEEEIMVLNSHHWSSQKSDSVNGVPGKGSSG